MASVLYIDDDEGLRRLVARALSRRDFEVETAEGGEAGLRMMQTRRFDVVAVDHHMPGFDGLETLARIQALETPPPVVYVTGSEDSRVAVAALKAGAADYVVKAIGDDFFDLLASSFRQVMERASLMAAKAEAEDALRAGNERLAALLKEANHRVANSLAIVAAFVRMQAGAASAEETRAALRDTQQRIAAIAQVHRHLYRADEIEAVEMDEYLRPLVSELEATWSSPHSPRPVRLDCASLRLPTDKAVSVGVIVAELVGNACKYAYREGEPGEIRVRILTGAGRFILSVEDDGGGTPISGATGTGIGSKLIRAMAHSLDAEPRIERVNGMRVTLDAPL